jgi:hypothetical protein
MIGGLETIEERRERVLRDHARANAERMRREFWEGKGEGGIPAQALAGE